MNLGKSRNILEAVNLTFISRKMKEPPHRIVVRIKLHNVLYMSCFQKNNTNSTVMFE